ncbi:MAG: hypothetical protein GXP54_13795 [Deltaproteobacteria bacterium]|nr:hypothetical protein [Deltaproteobacteria bacterium]
MKLLGCVSVAALMMLAACSSSGGGTSDSGIVQDIVTGDTGQNQDQGQVQDQGQTQDKGQIQDQGQTQDQGQVQDQGGGNDAGTPELAPPPIDWQWVYELDGDSGEWTGKVEGEEEIGGKTYHVGSIGKVDGGVFVGVKAWFDVLSPPLNDIGFLKLEYYDGNEKPGEFGFSYLCPDVPAGTIAMGDNSEKTVESDCKFQYYDGGAVSDMPVHIRLTYQLIATDETVTVPYGEITDCWHYSIKFFEDYGTGEEQPISTDVWIKPLLGIVKMSEVPGFPFGVLLNKVVKP